MDLKSLLENRGLWVIVLLAAVTAIRSLASIVRLLIQRNEPLENIQSFVLTVVLWSIVLGIIALEFLTPHKDPIYLIIVLVLLIFASLLEYLITSRFKK